MNWRPRMLGGLSALCLAACGAQPEGETFDGLDVGQIQEKIINGSVPADGSLHSMGVVYIVAWNGGSSSTCTGTLLSNQHVLTARHCVRPYYGVWATNRYTPINVYLEGPGSAEQFVPASANIWESTSLSLLEDWAIIELSTPMAIFGQPNSFYNPIYAGTDTALNNQNVFCIGYGNNALATSTQYQTGYGTLRTASLKITNPSLNYEFDISWNGSTQVVTSGDSGSTCFVTGTNTVTGVQSTCSGSGTDINSSGAVESYEFSSITKCTYKAPGAFRTWAKDKILTDVIVPPFDTVPALPAGTALSSRITTVNGTNSVGNAKVSRTLTDAALRAGWAQVEADVEPPNTLCTKRRLTTPLSGDLTARSICIGDGLVTALVNDFIAL